MDDTKGLIAATVIVTMATTFVRQTANGNRQFRSYLGAVFMGTFLTGIGMINEKLARNFCLLIILSTLLKDGGKIFAVAAAASGQSGVKSKASTEGHIPGAPPNAQF